MRFLLIIAVVVLIVGGTVANIDFLQNRLSGLFNQNEISWSTYTSGAFGFSVAIPSDWVAIEFPNDAVAPRVNIYPESQKKKLSFVENGIERISPITRQSNIPNVSIFPHGMPTEEFFGESTDSDVSFLETAVTARDFTLTNGSRFATVASFADAPESWGDAGFLWSRITVKSMRSECFRDTSKIKNAECDPLSGDTMVHFGRVNERDRDIQKTILSSFAFIPKQQ